MESRHSFHARQIEGRISLCCLWLGTLILTEWLAASDRDFTQPTLHEQTS